MRIRMGTLAELAPGKWLEKQILAKRVAVYNDGVQLFGIEANCKHMRASLTAGKVEDGVVICNWHGWRYDLKTGQCMTNTAFKLKTYTVEIRNGDVYLIL